MWSWQASRSNPSMRLLSCTGAALGTLITLALPAHALYGGYEHQLRDFNMGADYFLDLAPMDWCFITRDVWVESELRMGGPRGYRFAYGSTSINEAWFDHELVLRYELDPPWTWAFRMFQGESPLGRYRHLWTGMELTLVRGWSLYLFGEPLGDKEDADMGFSLRCERPSPEDADRIRWRWELRAIWPDLYYTDKNNIDARHEGTPFDLQLSARWAFGSRGWLSLDIDRDFPLTKVFGATPGALPEDQYYRFSFDGFSGEISGGVTFANGHRLLARAKGQSYSRSRRHFAPSDPADDWDADYDLALARLEWWWPRRGETEWGVLAEWVGFWESISYPNALTDRNRREDRQDRLLGVHCRRRVSDSFLLSVSLWCDLLDRTLVDSGAVLADGSEVLSKLVVMIELPTLRGRLHSANFALGASALLHRFDFGGGFGLFAANF